MAGPVVEGVARGELGLRSLSALVLGPLVLGAVWMGGAPFELLVLAAALVLAYEWDQLAGGDGRGFGAVALAAVLAVGVALAAAGLAGIGLLGLAAGSAVLGGLAARRGRTPLLAVVGPLYVGVPCVAVLWLRELPGEGRVLVLWLLAVVWTTDIAAYFVGRAVGGPKLAPRVSPSKTWAGLAGGVAAAVGAGALLARAVAAPSVAGAAVVAALLSLLAQGGDLFESWLKRRRGLKDTGRLIPGHGGLLDRVDGLLATTPVLAGLALAQGGSVLQWQ